MKTVLRTTLAALLALFATSAAADPAPTAAPAAAQSPPAAPSLPPMKKPGKITVLVARRIVTMDPALPTATAVAISDGRILSAGSLEDLKPWLDRYPHVIDRRFADKVLYPGFVEAHGHPLLGGITQTRPPLTSTPLPSPWGPPFPGVKSLDEALAKVADYARTEGDPSKLLVTWGWDVAALKAMPDRAMLDRASPGRPVVVWDSSEHNLFLNSAALQRYAITPEKAKGVLGVGLDERGQLDGRFLGVDAATFVSNAIGDDLVDPRELSRALLFASDLAQQGGITTMSELALGALDLEGELTLLRKATASPVFNQRVVAVADAGTFINKYGDAATDEVRKLRTLDTDLLLFRGVKFFSDDAYLANTMRVEDPAYTDGHHGVTFYPDAEAFAKVLWPWWDAGFQIHVHSNGTVGNRHTIDALQILQDRKPRLDHRFALQHFGITTSDVVRKVKALGAVVSVNPAYFYLRAPIQAGDLGTDRAATATRVGSLVREGVVVSLHSDNPVAPPVPLTEAWSAVTRRGLHSGDRVWAPAEAVTPEQAMRMITIDAAYTLGVDDLVGSLEPGKLADFVVLGDDPQQVPGPRMKDVPVVATILGGRVITVEETRKPRIPVGGAPAGK